MAKKPPHPAASTSPSVEAPEQAEGHQPERPYRPTERQCALLILYLVHAREEEFKKRGLKRNVSRARISQNTIRKICGRGQISPEFLLEVQEYLLAAGWALFCIGPTHYAIIKLESVHGWSRFSSKRIAGELELVPRGNFPWRNHEGLLIPPNETKESDENEGEVEEETEL